MSPVYCECSNDQSPQLSSWKSKVTGNKSIICWGMGGGVAYPNLDRAQKGLGPAEAPYWTLCVLSPLLINRTAPADCTPFRGVRGRAWFKSSSRWERDKAAPGLLFLWCTSKLSPPSLRVLTSALWAGCGGCLSTPCRWQGRSQEHSISIMGTSLDHWGATPIMKGKEKLWRISSSLESVEGTGKTQWRSNSYFMLLQTQITRSSSVQEILPLSTHSSPSVQNMKPCALLWAILELFLKTVWDFIKILVKVTLAAEPNNP